MMPEGSIFDTSINVEIERERESNFTAGIDLSTSGTRLTDFSYCIRARYDGGIGKHKMERTGIIKELC